MEAIVIFIWFSLCLIVITVAMLVAFAIARYVQGYTTKEIANDVWNFMNSDMEEY